MTEPFEVAAVDAQQFAAPGLAIGAEADAVERGPEQRPRVAVLGRDRGDVRVVVLHAEQRQAAHGGELGREARAEEVGVQVVRDRLRLHVEHTAQVLDGLDGGCPEVC